MRALAFVTLACALLASVNAEVVLSTEDVAIALGAEEPAPLRSLTLRDIVAKHVAFPRQSLISRTAEAREDEDACVSLEGPTCEQLRGPIADEEPVEDADDATALRVSETKRSRVSLVRLDDVEDLVKYFKRNGGRDLARLAAAAEENAGAVRDRLSALTRAAATAFAGAGGGDFSGVDAPGENGGESTSAVSSTDKQTPAENSGAGKKKSRWRDTGGPFDGSMKSVPGLLRRTAVFYNARASTVSVYWVDFSGKEVHYVDVHPRHQGVVKSFQGHVWIVRDVDTQRFIAQYVVGEESTRTQAFTIPNA